MTKRPRLFWLLSVMRSMSKSASAAVNGPTGLMMLTAPCRCSWIFIALLLPFRQRQGQNEGTALVQLRLHDDVAAVEAHDFAGQRQPEAGARDLRHARIFGAIELLENQVVFLGAD